jgi:hypothetical protein
MSQRAVVSACRELTDWGYVQRIVGCGSRPSEYMPNWITMPPYTAHNPDLEVVSGTHEDSTIATHGGHTKSRSGTHGGSESDLLLTGVEAELEVVSKSVSASGPPAEAAAVAGIDFERVWMAYGKLGDKAASKKAFAAIANPDVDHIASRASAWAASAKPGQRRMPLERWLAAEKYDEADRSVRRKPTETPDDMEEIEMRRKPTDADWAAESAKHERELRRSTIEIEVAREKPLTVIDSAIELRGSDKWLTLSTTRGRVAVLLEGARFDMQEEGRAHFARLQDACGVSQVNDSADLNGCSFKISDGTFAAVQEAA